MGKRAVTPEEKKAVIDRLHRAWLANPQLRLGQLIANYAPGVHPNTELYYAEDDAFIQGIEQMKTRGT